MKRWRNLDPEAVRGREPQAGDGARGRRPCSTRPARRPGSSCRRRRRTGRRSWCCPGPPRELHAMWPQAVRDRGVQGRRRAARPSYEPADAAPVRHPGVGDRRDAARRPRREVAGFERARDHDLPAPRRGRGRGRATSRRRTPAWERIRSIVIASATRDTLFSDDGSLVDDQVARAAGRAHGSAWPSRAPAG